MNLANRLGVMDASKYPDYYTFKQIVSDDPYNLSEKSKTIFNDTFESVLGRVDMLIIKNRINILYNGKNISIIMIPDREFSNVIFERDEKYEILNKYFVYIIYCIIIRRYLNLNIPEVVFNIITRVIFENKN